MRPSDYFFFVVGSFMGAVTTMMLLGGSPMYTACSPGPLAMRELLSLDVADTSQKSTNLEVHIDSGKSSGPFFQVDSQVADGIQEQVRVFCWISTWIAKHNTSARAVKETWGRRCSNLLFFSDLDDSSLPAMNLEGVPAGYNHLTAKTMKGFEYVHKHYGDQYDWFLKADDDTYVIMENLRHMLYAHSPTEALWFGIHFDGEVKGGFHSGGAGYVISREALRLFSARQPDLCWKDEGAEDCQFGKCMNLLGVKTGDSHDPLGGTRFHSFRPEVHLFTKKYPGWFYKFDSDKGRGNMSDFPISFHYMKNDMYLLDHFVYHVRPFGITHQILPPQR